MRDGLELEEFSAEFARVDDEWAGGRGTGGGGLGEEVIVGFGRLGGLEQAFFVGPSGGGGGL